MTGASSSCMAHLTILSTTIPKLNSPYHQHHIFTSPYLTNNTSKFTSICGSQSKIFQSSALRAVSSTLTTESPYQPETELQNEAEKFDWYAQWYPVMPVDDLDKRVPCGKTVMGLDVVVWWDKNESQWKVFNDMCPHRLAPLSEGRIDQLGRLQCVYHGWCFNASGDCKLIPQAPPDGPPAHTSKKACVAVYPSTVQNGIVWFWPNSDPKFKHILDTKKPPFLPELDDPSYTRLLSNRDINYGYEVLIENLMDPSHVPYAHYGLMKISPPQTRVDREGGKPLNLNVQQLDINGFTTKHDPGASTFFAPCIYYSCLNLAPAPAKSNGSASSVADAKDSSAAMSSQRRAVLIFICVPVSPGKSRLIWSFPRNFAVWMDQVIPRWIFHVGQNLILDSDLYLLHCQEQKIKELRPSNWQRVVFVPTKADAFVVGFRRWLNKYSDGEVEWRGKFSGGALPPTPPKEQLLDRYWTHTVNCASCNAAYKGLNVAETALQVTAFCLIGAVGLTKQGVLSTVQKSAVFSAAILCFAASKWLSHFIYKNFHFHDYSHALK